MRIEIGDTCLLLFVVGGFSLTSKPNSNSISIKYLKNVYMFFIIRCFVQKCIFS